MSTKTVINKSQLERIQKIFSRYVNDFSDMGISDFEYSDDTLQVFVQFDFCLRQVDIKSIDILNSDYEEIDSQNAKDLCSFIEKEITNYNINQTNIDEQIYEEQEYKNHVLFGLYY